MNNLIPLAFEEHLVRMVTRDGAPWFVGKDVCAAIGIRNHNDAMSSLDDDEKGVGTTDPLCAGGEQAVTLVSEPGVYRLVFRSRKPEAERFKRWLAHEVIPSIRKTGRYISKDECEPTDFDPPGYPARYHAGEAMMHRLQVIREARLLFGNERARNLWRDLGLPLVPPGPATPLDEANCCLRLLLQQAAHEDGPTIGDLIEDALEDSENARVLLIATGIKVFPERDAFAVANRHDFLTKVYKSTVYRGPMGHMRPLRRLPGTIACGPFRFSGINLRGTLVPAALLDDLVFS